MGFHGDGGWPGERKLAAGLLPVLALARHVAGCETVAEVLASPQFADLLRVAGTRAQLGAVLLDDVPPSVGLIDGFAGRIGEVVDECGADSVEVFVRVELEPRTPMSALGPELGIYRDALRRRKARVSEALEARCGPHATLIAAQIESGLSPLVRERDVSERIDAALSPIAAARGSDDVVTMLARHLVAGRLVLARRGDFLLTTQGETLVDELAAAVKAEADDVGLVDLDATLASRAPALVPHRAEVIEVLRLAPLGAAPLAERVALRDTVRARAKAALIEIGRSATKDEIAAVTGTPADRLSGALSVIDSVARADKTRWGLVEWIDDAYDSIPACIERRIREHGGPVSLKFLEDDIAERYGVLRESVRSFAGTTQFEIVDDMVSLVDPSSYEYRPLHEVSTRDAEGNLCWDFKVQEQYKRGYSILGMPPELANYLGCEPNSQQRVHIAGSADETAVVSWRLSTIGGGAELGRVRAALGRLGANGGDQARLIISPDRSIRFELLEAPPA